MCGGWLAPSLLEAAELCFFLDALQVAIVVYGWLFSQNNLWQGGVQSSELQSALIGLPAGALVKYVYASKPAVNVAILSASAAAVAFTYTLILQLEYMMVTQLSIESLELQVSWAFMPSQWLFAFIVLLIAINHALLAWYCYRRLITMRSGQAHAPARHGLNVL